MGSFRCLISPNPTENSQEKGSSTYQPVSEMKNLNLHPLSAYVANHKKLSA